MIAILHTIFDITTLFCMYIFFLLAVISRIFYFIVNYYFSKKISLESDKIKFNSFKNKITTFYLFSSQLFIATTIICLLT